MQIDARLNSRWKLRRYCFAHYDWATGILPVGASQQGGILPVGTSPTGRTGILPVLFPFFAARRSRLDFGFGPFVGKSDANPPAFISTNRQVACVSKWLQWCAIPQHLPASFPMVPLLGFSGPYTFR